MSLRDGDDFGTFSSPEVEVERLENLYQYQILDTPSDPFFNDLAYLTASYFNVPIALINFVDKDRVWTKANQAGETGAEVNRDISLCSLAIQKRGLTIFKDATKAECLLSNPLVAGSFGLRFYAGAPIVSPEGYNIGAICIIDRFVRDFPEEEYRKLQWLAEVVRKQLCKRMEGKQGT